MSSKKRSTATTVNLTQEELLYIQEKTKELPFSQSAIFVRGAMIFLDNASNKDFDKYIPSSKQDLVYIKKLEEITTAITEDKQIRIIKNMIKKLDPIKKCRNA